MPNIFQLLRSTVSGNRPPNTRLDGEPYVNFPEKQLGVMQGGAAIDLIGVPFFSTLKNYSVGNVVNQGGLLYIATAAVTAGAFNPAQWAHLGTTVIVSDTAPVSPGAGALWYDSVGGQLYVYYSDANSTQWVIATNQNLGGVYLALAGGTMTGDLHGTNGYFASITGPRVGIIDGSNATAGMVGEYLEADGVNTPLGSGSSVSVSNSGLTLPPGDWETWGQVLFSVTGGGNGASGLNVGVSSTINALPGSLWTNAFNVMSGGYSSCLISAPRQRFNVTTNTSVFLGVQATFVAPTAVTAVGSVYARRMR